MSALVCVPRRPYANSAGDAISQGLSQFALGTHSVVSAYYGDPSFSLSTSSSVPFTITQAATTLAVTSQPAPQGNMLVATVNTAGYGNPPTGMVTFYSGSASLGTASVVGANAQSGVAQAIATLSDSQLASGQYTITATYSGDANYTASTSTPVTVALQSDFALSPNSSSVDIAAPGGSGNVVLTVTALNGFNGAVSFTSDSCSKLAEIICSFSPASITGSGTTQVTIATTGPHAAAARGATFAWRFSRTWIGLGILLPGIFVIAGSARRRNGAALMILMAAVLTLSSCGGGSTPAGGGGGGGNSNPTDPGTPLGTYTITVTATSGNLVHTTSFQLIVQ